MSNVEAIGFRGMATMPAAGSRVMLLMKDGTRLDDCIATNVITMDGASGLVIYHKRKAVDLRNVKGWWPMRRDEA